MTHRMPIRRAASDRNAAAILFVLCIATVCLADAARIGAQEPQYPFGPPATATLHPTALRQPIYGFGGSQTFNGEALADYPGRERVYEAMFGELKLDIYRLRNYHDYDGQQEKFERVTREFANAARRWSDPAKRGDKGPVRLMLSSWSPPSRLKSNNLISGRSDGTPQGLPVTLKRHDDGRYMYAEFAEWWLASLEKFNELCGVYPDYITLQNELDCTVAYEGCQFLPSEGVAEHDVPMAGYDQALATVADRLKQALGERMPKILGPETFTIRLESDVPGAPGPAGTPRVVLWVNPATESGKAALERLWGIAYHIYDVDAEIGNNPRYREALKAVRDAYHQTGKPMFQTEFLRGDSLLEVAQMIHDALAIGEASAYFIWISGRSTRLPGYGVVYYNPEDQSIERRERFYAIKHYSAFVGEGWNRIDAQCDDQQLQLSAYVKPASDELVAVVINPGKLPRRFTLKIEGHDDLAATAWQTVQGEAGERWREMKLNADGALMLLPFSVTTVKFPPSR